MKTKLLLIIFLTAGLITVGSLTVTTHGTFTSQAVNENNTFIAASAFPTPTPTLAPTATPVPTPTGEVVINEINWGGNNNGGGANDEWVELRNMSASVVDLSNWFIENLGNGVSIVIPAGKSVAANGYFLLSAKNASASKINVTPDLIDNGISLVDTGEQLKLKKNTGILVDVANPIGAWSAGSSVSPVKSMERINVPGDGTVGSNWQTATTHTNMDGSTSSDEFGTPKAANGL